MNRLILIWEKILKDKFGNSNVYPVVIQPYLKNKYMFFDANDKKSGILNREMLRSELRYKYRCQVCGNYRVVPILLIYNNKVKEISFVDFVEFNKIKEVRYESSHC